MFIHPNIQAQNQTQPPRTSAHRITDDIVIDGHLNESEWNRVEPIRNLYQIQPNEGEPVTQPTEVRILYDSKKIYFGFIFYDSEIEKLVANEMRRDASGLRSNDYGFLLLDTYNDRRNAVFFRFTPLGGMEDGAVSNSGDTRNTSWDIVWECRCSINTEKPSNWTAELAIPFSQLRFERNDVMTWGINFGREIARNNELGAWHPAPKTYGPLGKYRTAYFGTLEGLEGIVPSKQIEILPYILGGLSQLTSNNSTQGVTEAGLDLKYSFTPNLTGDFTYNTDFAQVESDELQVNLTRFSLFYEEQRPFFLEGAGIFDVGIPRPSFRRPPPLLLFYSRRIGLANERAIPILAGGKITGKMGSYDIGLLNIYTNEFQDDDIHEPRTNYSVLRLNRDILKNSSFGAILINKQDTDNYNRTAGIDFSYRPFRTVDIQGLWTRSFDTKSTENPNAYYLGSEWRTNLIQLNGSYTEIGEDYNPEVGYVHRTGIRRINGNTIYTPWPRKYGIRTIELGPEVDIVLTQENELESRDISFETQFSFESGENFSVQVRNSTEHLTSDFLIQGEHIRAGNYDFNVFQTSLRTSSSRRVYGSLRIELGEYYDGSRRGIAIDATLKPTVRLSIEPTIEFNRIKLPSNEFDANVFGGRIGYSFSTTLFSKMFLQWSSDREVISTNFLVNYIYRPGSDIYLVFNQNYDTHGDNIQPLDWTIIGKITYWWNP
ncbi:hypothetical protein C6497_03910 [Candidatus Poribacteria bacterium]|nr:MAG: hypothetical protein C6497_03910 [Candidatus Poribacteria bacterium]